MVAPVATAVVCGRRSHVKMPSMLLAAYETGVPLTGANLVMRSGVTADDLSALVQWSDLILFDFITGHYDR